MTKYKIAELKPGTMYKCVLSGITMLIIIIPEKWVDTFEGRQITHWHLGATYYNPVTGGFNTISPNDEQFTDAL